MIRFALTLSTTAVALLFATNDAAAASSRPKATSSVAGTSLEANEPRIWLTQPATDRAAVIDAETNAVETSFSVGDNPSRVAFSKKGHLAYITHTNSNTIHVIDAQSHTIVGAPIAVGATPGVLTVAPNGKHLYVGVSSGLQVIDTATRSIIATIGLASTPTAIAVTPDSSRVFIANSALVLVDAVSHGIVATLYPGHFSTHVTLSPDGDRAYVSTTNYYDSPSGFSAAGHIAILDTSTGASVGTINTGSLPGAIAFAPDGSHAYAILTATWVNTGYGAGFAPARHVVTIDAQTNAITHYTDVGKTAGSLALALDGSKLFASVSGLSNVTVIDTTTHTVTATIPISGGVGALTATP